MIAIKQTVLELLDANQKAKGRLAYDFAKTTKTIDQWINENNIMLTTASAVKAIAEELQIKESEILTEA